MANNKSKQGSDLSNYISNDDEIDLRELFTVIWTGKWIILVVVSISCAIAFFYAVNQPNVYRSEALLSPVEQEASSAFGGLQNQLGGLASFAGVNLGSGTSNNTQLAVQILTSRHFTSKFIEKRNILIDLMAAETWNMRTNTVIFDPKLYDETKAEWVREVSAPLSIKPSMQEAYKVFMDHVEVNLDKETGLIKLSVKHVSPFVAQQWVEWLVEDINEAMKIRDVVEAEESTAFLMLQLDKTRIADIRAVLFKLVEEQAKTIMFANVRDEYIFKTIDPAFVPEQKYGPKRAVIIILGATLGGLFAIMFIVFRHFKNK